MDTIIKSLGVGRYAHLLFLIHIYLFLSLSANAQSFGYAAGSFNYKYKDVNPIKNQGKHYRTDKIKIYILQYPLNENFSISFVHSNYWGWTSFAADDELRNIGNESAYTRLNRYGLQANWNVWRYKKYVTLSPFLRIDYEKNDVQISGLTNSTNYLPDPQNNYEGSIFVETYEGGQILPTLGLTLSLRPYWKIWIFGDLFYSIGHKTYQRLYFDYSYKGVMQPRAEWHSQGSGFVKSIGIGIDLWDVKKSNTR